MTHTKANKSKILTLILGLATCFVLMLGIVLANPTSTVYAEGATFEYIEIKGDKDVTSTDGTYTYTMSDKTLILNNYNGGQFLLNDDATLVLQGNNVITVNENSHFPNILGNKVQGATGVQADKGLTITGSGTLTINVDITKAEERGKKIMAYGITTSGDTGSLTIKDNVKITVNINEGGSEYGTAISAAQDLSIIENASVDITTVNIAIYSDNGKIIFSGTGDKKIKIDRTIEDWENKTVEAVYAWSEDVDISGTGKVLLEAVNGKKICAIYARNKSIKFHDNANVEINDFESGMRSSNGIDIKNSNVKIFSTLKNASAFDIDAGGNRLLIQDSAVTVDVYSAFVGSYDYTSLELQIYGNSTVYVQSTNPAMCDNIGKNVRKHFALSEGGSITLRTLSDKHTKFWAELGEGTNLEVGKKLGQSETNPTRFEYEASQVYLYMTRFVYGDTSKASATMNDVTIKGLRGEAMPDTDVKITLTGDNFKAIAKDTDVTSWFKNMPKGLSAKVKADVAAGATEMTITISGTPTEASSAFILIEIPVGTLQTATYSLIVQTTNIKFDIVSGTPVDVPTAATGFVYDGAVKIGIPEPADKSYTVTNGSAINAGTHTATLTLNKGFKWADGSTEPKTVTWEIARMPDVEIEVTLTQTEYEYTGLEISAYFTITMKGTDKIIDKSECDITYTNNKEVGEATVEIKDNGKGNYAIKNTVKKTFTIKKRTTGEPTGLTGVAPSADGAKDGKITGTTADMEYSTDKEFTSPKPCGDGETAGLAEGTYYVRYKATTTNAASNSVAVHVRLNTVTVVDGDGTKVTKHKSGTSVTVTVTIPTGKSFTRWIFENVTIPTEDVTKQVITFTMPEKDVKLTALFEDIIYNITVTNGNATPEMATYQTEVTVTANAPATGKEFDKWVVTGITLSDEDLAKSTVTFKMPASNVKMEAHFRDIESAPSVEIKVNGGTGAGTYKAGESVTVTANEPAEGKEFVGWQDESGNIVSTQKEYTFVVKDGMVLTAVYQDKAPGGGAIDGEIAPAPDKNGLSGGQIAGIVIGSIAGVGIIGFAIFWFVVKKKTFAELISAIKALFSKKQ